MLQQAIEKELEQHRAHITPDSWVKRDPRLVPLTGPLPFNGEPLTQDLMQSLITPTSLHYVRNHGHVPKLEWESHSLNLFGLVQSRQFSMEDLLKVGDPVEMIVTVACDGNRRKELNMIKHTKGFNWGPGACGTSKWKGISLFDLIRASGGLSGMFLQFSSFLLYLLSSQLTLRQSQVYSFYWI